MSQPCSCNRSYGSRARARDCPGQHRPKPPHSVRMRHSCCSVGTRPPRSNTSTAIASDMPKTASDTLGAHRPPLVVGVRRGSIIRPKPRSLPRPLEELSDPRRLLDRRSLFGRVTRSSRSQQEASPIVVARSAGSAVARAMRPAHLPTSPAALELRLVLHDVEYRRCTSWAGCRILSPLRLSGWPRAAEARRRRRVAARMPRRLCDRRVAGDAIAQGVACQLGTRSSARQADWVLGRWRDRLTAGSVASRVRCCAGLFVQRDIFYPPDQVS